MATAAKSNVDAATVIFYVCVILVKKQKQLHNYKDYFPSNMVKGLCQMKCSSTKQITKTPVFLLLPDMSFL